MGDAIKKADAAVAAIVPIPDSQRTFENTVLAIDEAGDDLKTAVSLQVLMKDVGADDASRRRGQGAVLVAGNWGLGVWKNAALYRAVRAYAATNPRLEGERKRLLDFTLRDFRRSGMDLDAGKRARLATVERLVGIKGLAFAKNIADDATVLALTREELDGIPESRLEGYKRDGERYLVTLGESDAYAILGGAKNPETRRRFYHAYNRRGGTKNVQLLEETLKLRAEQASILGYASPAAFEMEPRMAKTPEAVAAFYDRLRPLARKKAKRDYDELLALKRKDAKGAAALELWDVDYYGNRLKATKYKVDGERLAEYFPTEGTFKGLLGVASTLYGIEFRDATAGAAELWHPDAKKVEVWDKATKGKLGTLYFDLYPRPGKYTHAACFSLVSRRRLADGTFQLPASALVCNLTPPTKDKPGLLPYEEVVVLFHEFGHALHEVLTEATVARFSGSNVELDFAEAPSQMFENWVSDPKVLATFARHYRTGRPIPGATLKALAGAKGVGSGLMLERREVQGIADQRYHTAPGGVVDATKVWFDTHREVSLFPELEGTLFPAAWGHPMGGYQAGYYGYVWSKVYAQDMFGRFEKMGLLNPEAGAYYRRKILARGGTMDGMDMVRDYLGREPNMDAFLRDLGGGR